MSDMQTSAMERLFVYGTLAPGRPNEHVLEPLRGQWEPATVSGTLKQVGWGAAMGFPAIDLSEATGAVSGLLFSSVKLVEYWPALDDFEGSAYERVITVVTLADGSTVDAFVYAVSDTNTDSA